MNTPTDWEAESDLHTLLSAHKIAKDPDRVKRAKDFAKRKAAEMSAIVGKGDQSDMEQIQKGYRSLGK